jgi:hypothetical protein
VEQLLDHVPGQPTDDGQIGDKAGQVRPELADDVVRHARVGRAPAMRTRCVVTSIFGHVRLDARHLRHLVPARRADDVPPTQRALTAITRRWDEIDDGIDALRGNQRPAVAAMTRLAAGPAPTLSPTPSNPWPAGKAVRRWWPGGSRRVLLAQRQLPFEVGNAFLSLSNLFLRLVQCPFTLGQFAAQSLVLSLQPLAIVDAWPLVPPQHPSDGTPIRFNLYRPLNSYDRRKSPSFGGRPVGGGYVLPTTIGVNSRSEPRR